MMKESGDRRLESGGRKSEEESREGEDRRKEVGERLKEVATILARPSNSEIILYQTEDGRTTINVRL